MNPPAPAIVPAAHDALLALVPDRPTLGVGDLAPLVGESRRQLVDAVRDGHFPPPDYHLSPRRPRWLRSTVVAWMQGVGARREGVAHAD